MANTPEVINGKVVKRWFSRGKARIPIFEDGSIGLDTFTTKGYEDKNKIGKETREQYRRWQNASYQGHTKEYYEHIEKKWEDKMKSAKDTKEYNMAKSQRDAWQSNRIKAVAYENMKNEIYDGTDFNTEDKSASKMIDYNAKTRVERYRNYNTTYNTTDPRKVADYYLKKGEFKKFDNTIKEYGLEDEKDEFLDGANTTVRNDYKEYRNRVTGMTKQEETHSYTRQQLKDKYGTDDVDLINAGKAKEDRVSLKEEKRKTISDLRKEMATEKLNSYKDTQNHDEVQYFKNEKELEEKYESDLRFYEDFSYGLEQEFGLKMDRPDVGKYKVRAKEPKNMKTMTELQEEEIPDNYMEAELNTSKAKVERFKEGKGRTSIQDNTKQIRAEIKGMKEMETKEYGDLVVKKIGNTYAIKHKGNEDDPYTDYSSYTYGFKQKHTIEMILEELNKK